MQGVLNQFVQTVVPMETGLTTMDANRANVLVCISLRIPGGVLLYADQRDERPIWVGQLRKIPLKVGSFSNKAL